MHETTKETLDAWFDAVEAAITKYEVLQSNIYNMDETGFAIGSMESTRVIIDSSTRTHWQTHPSRQEWVSVVECIGADGTAIRPLVIFKGQEVSSNWVPDNLDGLWAFSSNAKGWSSNTMGMYWLEHVFDPATCEKAEGRTRLLICDGHDSHINGWFISYCMENNIHLLILPPHTSHILQPLDVAIFGPLKRALTEALTPHYEARLEKIHKIEWIDAYSRARKKALNSQNIASSWRGPGLFPFNRQKAIRRMRGGLEEESGIATTTPRTPRKAIYENVYVNSLSPDYEAYQKAMIQAIEDMDTRPLDRPAKKFLKEALGRSEQSSAKRIIHEHETTAQRNALNQRRNITKGKRVILKNKILVTTEELRDGVALAEKETLERSQKISNKRAKTTEKPAQLSSDDTEFIDASEDVEIQDSYYFEDGVITLDIVRRLKFHTGTKGITITRSLTL